MKHAVLSARRIALGFAAVMMSAGVVHADEHWHDHDYRDHEYREHEFHEHRYLDSHFHHDHYYPPPGFVFSTIPPGFGVVIHGGRRFYFSGGIWYRFDGPGRYVVIAPPFGVLVPVLPPYYTTIYVNGAPYYYANNTYYAQTPQGYMVVEPPPPNAVVVEQGPATAPPPPSSPAYPPPPASGGVVELPPANAPSPVPPGTSPGPPPSTVAQTGGGQLFIYPRQGQSDQQQAADRSQCHSWAVNQIGVDPTAAPGGENTPKYADYRRAMGACLDARGYTVR